MKFPGKRERGQKEWLSEEKWNLITQVKRLKVGISRCAEQGKKSNLTSRYWQLNKDVRKSAKKDKKKFLNALATEAKSGVGERNMKRLPGITKTMSVNGSRHPKPVKNKEGVAIFEEQKTEGKMVEHLLSIHLV